MTVSQTEIVVRNPLRSRVFGWGWTNNPTGNGPYSIETPEAPDYTGTIGQVRAAIAADRTVRSMRSGGVCISTAWFYGGRRIVGINFGTGWTAFRDYLTELDGCEFSGIAKPAQITIRVV